MNRVALSVLKRLSSWMFLTVVTSVTGLVYYVIAVTATGGVYCGDHGDVHVTATDGYAATVI